MFGKIKDKGRAGALEGPKSSFFFRKANTAEGDVLCPADSFENKFQVFNKRIRAAESNCLSLGCENSVFTSSFLVYFFPLEGFSFKPL